MKPPSESVKHSLQKLAEARANRNSGSTSTPAPPPYTLSVTRPSGTSVMSIDPLDQADYYYQEEPTPITIHIDNSINVSGNGNTVNLPAFGSGSTTVNGETKTATPTGSLAAVIIGALSRANALRDDTGVLRPININVNSGVRVDGERNVVSRGVNPKPDVGSVKKPDNIAQKRRASSVRTTQK